jgi:hypothetical protein
VKSVKNFRYVEKTSAECNRLVFGYFTSLKSRIALQVARKIAPCIQHGLYANDPGPSFNINYTTLARCPDFGVK